MDTENKQPYISDASKPNAGRVYDYLLEGNHNFEIDKKAAEEIIKLAPFIPKFVRLVRWFIGVAVRRTLERGFTRFLDFASGLPTVDHIHSRTPPGTKVIYSDFDPITVEYGKDIIGDNPNIKYEFCDAGNPETLLESKVVKDLFGDNHKLVIGFNGICWFLSNEQISHAMKVLYEWADVGAVLFLTDVNAGTKTKEIQAIIDLYSNMKQPIGMRTKEQFIELIKPWKIEEPGLLPLEEWYDLEPDVTKEFIKKYGGGGAFSGFLTK